MSVFVFQKVYDAAADVDMESVGLAPTGRIGVIVPERNPRPWHIGGAPKSLEMFMALAFIPAAGGPGPFGAFSLR